MGITFFVEVLNEVLHMGNEMMERVEQLEEKVKVLEGNLQELKALKKQVSFGCSEKDYCF